MHVACEAVTLKRGEVLALRDVTLEVPEGAHLCITGRAGAGKTALAKLLVGLVMPTTGHLRWNGVEVRTLPVRERRAFQGRFGMVFQTDALFDSLSALENVAAPLRRRGCPPLDAAARASQALEQVGLAGAADALPQSLSGGMKKRLGLARALAGRPEVLVADDPVAGLDPENARKVWSLLQEASAGRTLVACVPEAPARVPFDACFMLVEGLLTPR